MDGAGEIYLRIGKRLRYYRKRRDITLDELASLINKSRSTISKYEQGSIAPDIETLYLIARMLNISIYQLLDDGKIEPSAAHFPEKTLFGSEAAYIYMANPASRKPCLCYLLQPPDSDTVIFYQNVNSYDDYTQCTDIYRGFAESHDSITRFMLQHVLNPIGHIVMCFVKPFTPNDVIIGILSGVSDIPHQPVSCKAVASRTPLSDMNAVNRMLQFSSAELHAAKKYSYYMVIPTP